MNVYRRRLPHLHVLGQPLFVTFRLHGSLPSNRSFCNENITSGQAFLAMDRLLDCARTGPMYLRQPAIAELVVRAIDYGAEALGHYECHGYVAMPNHVHLLITPHASVTRLLGSMKAATAKRANALLKRSGQPFWQEESYDRLVRNATEFRRIAAYIDNNPVRAGLANRPEQYPWSSAGRRGTPLRDEVPPHET